MFGGRDGIEGARQMICERVDIDDKNIFSYEQLASVFGLFCWKDSLLHEQTTFAYSCDGDQLTTLTACVFALASRI